MKNEVNVRYNEKWNTVRWMKQWAHLPCYKVVNINNVSFIESFLILNSQSAFLLLKKIVDADCG